MPGASQLERAARLADDLLLPSAPQVDGADRVPESHFEALAREGLYDFDGDLRIIEALASGCLTTAFVWLQLYAPLASAATGHPDLHAALASGRLKGGVARAGARSGTRSLIASSTKDGYVLNGQVPWVTGWGMIDVVEVAALDENDNIIFLLVDATDSPTLAFTVRIGRLPPGAGRPRMSRKEGGRVQRPASLVGEPDSAQLRF